MRKLIESRNSEKDVEPRVIASKGSSRCFEYPVRVSSCICEGVAVVDELVESQEETDSSLPLTPDSVSLFHAL